MGTALVSVIKQDTRGHSGPKIITSWYNQSRGIHNDLIRTISSMMGCNLCLSGSHPLIAAVKPFQVNIETLSSNYDPSDPPIFTF